MNKQHKSKLAPTARRKRRGQATPERADPFVNPNQVRRPGKLGATGASRKRQAEVDEKRTAASAAPAGEAGTEEGKTLPEQRKRRRKQVALGVAMRKIGLDEYAVAEGFAGLIGKLGTKGGEAKVLLDVLKESTRHLEPLKGTEANESDETGVILRHDVPRPERNALQEGNATEPGAR